VCSSLRGRPDSDDSTFELLLEPLEVRLRFRDDLESWAIDALIAYRENSARYDPKQSALLTYLVMDADSDIKNASSSAQATRERFLEDVEGQASRRDQTTDDEKLAEVAAVPPPGPCAVQRGLTNDFRGIDGYGWYLGGRAAPLAREKLVATLAAETVTALA
jgi:hypothetical protein